MSEPSHQTAGKNAGDNVPPRGVTLFDLGHRTQIEISGNDRASFLHNLCTNEIRKLPVGSGCEAFLTTVQGKTLGHGFVFASPHSLVFSTVSGEAETILKHLDHYLVCEQVTLVDRSQDWIEFLVGGPKTTELLQSLTGQSPPQVRLAHAEVSIDGHTAWLRRVDMIGEDSFVICVPTADREAVQHRLIAAGALDTSQTELETARIERGFPLFGVDINSSNLPQEVGRDTQAISFVKGCYLGQETVARIDALGHVNKTLVGLRGVDSTLPASGSELSAGGAVVGHVTSAAYSPRLNAVVGLGYVRRGSNAPGTTLSTTSGELEVVTLPMTE